MGSVLPEEPKLWAAAAWRRRHRSMPQALLLSGCHLLIALTAAGGGDATALHLLLDHEARLRHAGARAGTSVRAQRQLALRRQH